MYPGRHKCIQGDISVSRATKVYPGRYKCIQGAWKHIFSDWMLFLRGFAEIPAYRHLSDVHTSGIKKSLSKGKVIFYFFPAHTTNFRSLGPSFVTQWYYLSFSCKIFFLRGPAEIPANRHLSGVRTSGVKKSRSKGNIIFYFFPAYTKNFRPLEQTFGSRC